jgi:phosphatidate cytidylyltransferase
MLKQRVLTALILAPLALLVVLWVPHAVTRVVLALLVLVGAWEWAAFPGLIRMPARAGYVAIAAVLIAAAWWLESQPLLLDTLLAVALLWWIVALLWIAFMPNRVSRWAAAIAGFLVLVPAWIALTRLHQINPQLVLFLLLLVVAADVGAYFSGRQFGRHKLAPRVSPGKTWEGVGGGLFGAAIMASIGVWWFGTNGIAFVMLCLVVVFASIVGDLTESLFKRHAGLKDSGTLLPGHGGVLDRVDSVTAAAPFFLVGLDRLGLLR